MALIAVAQPGQRETQLDAIAKALNIAQSIYGIKTASEQMDLQRAREARVAEMEKKQEARLEETAGFQREQMQAAREQREQEMAMVNLGAMPGKEFSSNYYEVSPEAAKELSSQFKGVPIAKVRVFEKDKEGKAGYSEKLAVKISTYENLMNHKMKMDYENAKRAIDESKEARKIADTARGDFRKNMMQDNFMGYVSGLWDVVKLLPEEGKDISGMGATKDIPKFMKSQEGKALSEAWDNVVDILGRGRTGAAMPKFENEFYKHITGGGVFASDKDFKNALNRLIQGAYQNTKMIENTLPGRGTIDVMPILTGEGLFTTDHPLYDKIKLKLSEQKAPIRTTTTAPFPSTPQKSGLKTGWGNVGGGQPTSTPSNFDSALMYLKR